MSEKSSKTINLNFETVGSLVAMLVGGVALFVAWDQAQVMRKQQHASVWPILSTDFFIDSDDESLFLQLVVANNGIGPAIVESAFVTLNGEKTSSRSALMDFIFADIKPPGPANLGGQSIEQTVIGANDTVRVFRISWPINEDNIASFHALADRYVAGEKLDVAMTICYCSVFDRCFVSNSIERPYEVDKCSPPTGLFTKFISDRQVTEQ